MVCIACERISSRRGEDSDKPRRRGRRTVRCAGRNAVATRVDAARRCGYFFTLHMTLRPSQSFPSHLSKCCGFVPKSVTSCP